MEKINKFLQKIDNKSYYLNYAKNVYSQAGDDGVIEKILEELDIREGIAVEFGAWDGILLSNTYNLLKNKKYNFNHIFIEADSFKFKVLQKNMETYSNADCINAKIGLESPDTIDDILINKTKFKISKDDVSIMSIDIDGIDLKVFKSINFYFPKVVIIESIGCEKGKFFISDQGSSQEAIYETAKEKGYKMVASTGNCYLVRNDFAHKLKKQDSTIEEIYCSPELVHTLYKVNKDGEI